MNAELLLVLVVVVAFVAARVVSDWLARRFLLVSGAEYLLLGLLLGPAVSGLLPATTMRSFAPVIAFALGWVGLLVGMHFYVPRLVRIHRVLYRLAMTEALVTLALVSGAMYVLLRWVTGLDAIAAVMPAVALGAIGAASAPAAIGVATAGTRRRTRGMQLLELTTAFDSLVAIVAMGVLACLFHPDVAVTPRAPTPTEWAVITVGIGVVTGMLFHLFLGDEAEADRLVVSVVGAVILASGGAAYLGLSPLLATLVMGIVLVNSAPNRNDIRAVLVRAERPLHFVLLILAGAAWHVSARESMLLVATFLVVRAASKLATTHVATVWNNATPTFGLHWGRALLGQGGLAIALALDYTSREGAITPDIVFTAALVSVLVTDLSSARFVRSALDTIARATAPEKR
jgi:hypothetical protein